MILSKQNIHFQWKKLQNRKRTTYLTKSFKKHPKPPLVVTSLVYVTVILTEVIKMFIKQRL